MPQPDMIGFTVRDMAATLRFYRLLGLDIPEGLDTEDHVETKTPNGYRLAWDTEALVRELHPDWVEPRGQRMTIAFLCQDADEVDQTYSKLVAAGYSGVREPWDAFWGQRYAMISDPDGNTIDLFAPLA